jgi:hypothetical protein
MRTVRLIFAALLATLLMGFAANAASALTVTVRAGTGTATISGLTLNDSFLANVLGNLTLNYSVPAGTYISPGTRTVGSITGGAGVIITPTGLTLRLNTPYTITSTFGLLADGSLGLIIPNASFTLTGGPLGPLNYTGTVSFLLNRAGTVGTVTASSFRNATTGGTAAFLGSPAFAISPAISFG